MRLGWPAGGIEVAAGQGRRIKGYRHVPKLAAVLRHAVGAVDPSTRATMS